MTLYLDSADVRVLATVDVAIQAASSVLDAERAGDYALPARLDVDLANGFFRVMPAAVGPYMGVKIMSLVRSVGNRYLLLLYAQRTGDLVAVLDADEVTRHRTAATTAVAGRLLVPDGESQLGLIGTGFEAECHLRAFAAMWPVRDVLVFSRSERSRQDFADRMSEELRIRVAAADSSSQVIAHSPATLLCTKATEPVVDGTDFATGAAVLSIGSTRLDLRELDRATLSRSAAVVVDNPEQVVTESGDIADALASGSLRRDQIVAMADWPNGTVDAGGERDLVTFKSVGTALQDLLLAARLVDAARDRGLGRDLGELANLKAAPAVPVTAADATGGGS